MATIYEIRRDNLRSIIAERGSTSVAKACGYNGPSYMSQMAGKNPSRPITEDNARKFEQGLGLPKGWLDIERTPYGQPVENTPPPETQDKPIPVTMVDMDRFTQVATRVRDTAKDQGVPLTTAKFTEIVSLVYENYFETESARKNFANRLVGLAGGSVKELRGAVCAFLFALKFTFC